MVPDSKKQHLKKAFLIYKDSLTVLDLLTDEQAGKLFKAIRDHQDGKEPELELALKIAFIPFQNQFDRDVTKYDNITERNRLNGAKGGRPKKTQINPETQSNPKKADTVKVKVKETEKEINNYKKDFDLFWSIFDKKTDRKKCELAWIKTTENYSHEKISEILQQAKKYKVLTPDAKYRKNPLTWINGECWNDEMEQVENLKKYIPTR